MNANPGSNASCACSPCGCQNCRCEGQPTPAAGDSACCEPRQRATDCRCG